MTFKNNKEVMEKSIEMHHQYLEEMKTMGINGNWTLQDMFQPIPTFFAEHGKEKGGNVLGLDRFDDNLQRKLSIPFSQNPLANVYLVWQTYLAWEDPAQDDMMHAIGEKYIAELDEFAKSVDADNPWIYLDYAFKTQNPLASYGEENLQKMNEVAKKYDPEGVFQTMVPGGFKLSRAGGQEGGSKIKKHRKREL
jgi:hypothetical protein